MIFVTVGTAERGIEFERLVREMDRVAAGLGEDVLIQRGTVPYEPRHARHVRFVRFDEALRFFREADLIVGHAGAGTVLNALRLRKPIVIVPRRAAEGELDSDDHQVQLARQVEGAPGVRVVWEMDQLEGAVRDLLASRGSVPRPSPERARLIGAIREFLSGPTAARPGPGP